MVIKVLDLQGGSMPLDFTEKFVISDAYSVSGDIMAYVKGDITKNEDLITLSCRITAPIVLSCGLCLAPTNYNLDLCLKEVFSDTLGNDDMFWEFDGKIIDITPALLSNILLNLPMKVLCSENCKGLCPVCGKDLNFSECGCNLSNIDPRWLGLFEKEV